MWNVVFLFAYLVGDGLLLSPGCDLCILVGAEEVQITGSRGDWARVITKEI